MVVPAHQHAVVGMSGAAARVIVDVVDLTPLGLDVAARDDAASVAEPDGAALVAGAGGT